MFTLGDKYENFFVVNEQVYNGFISIFKDTNPLHTDEQFAINKGFKGCVMHGNILNGFVSYFIGECLPDKDVIIHKQEIIYKNPVYINDQLLFEAQLVEIYESVNSFLFKFTFKNEDLKVVAKGQVQIGLLK
jgi:3-hydroxybutyryl-CoA dehydratase